ncbi:MAG: type II toxin-antitoxin system HicB family antitoxin [Burkholderiaceae bacterium]|nr:type II toxin-antitoxin system HicB family antitoxin [Burkholderiaceae bacterium]
MATPSHLLTVRPPGYPVAIVPPGHVPSWGAMAIDMPGVHAEGRTVAEALVNLGSEVAHELGRLAALGHPAPAPTDLGPIANDPELTAYRWATICVST